MSHSVTQKVGNTKWYAHFDSTPSAVHVIRENVGGVKELHIPEELILAVVASWVRGKRISELEQTHSKDILGL